MITPMGVSQWREHGKMFGYWNYFEKQTKKQSIVESIVNTFVGTITSFISAIIIYWLMNIPITLYENIVLTIIFTIVSIGRNYIVRRIFNK